jgi:hypothetical protein
MGSLMISGQVMLSFVHVPPREEKKGKERERERRKRVTKKKFIC